MPQAEDTMKHFATVKQIHKVPQHVIFGDISKGKRHKGRPLRVCERRMR